MAAELANNLLLAAALVALHLVGPSSARFSIMVSSSDIDAICTKAKNPAFCQEFLKSNPKTASVDLGGLAKITIDSAQATASDALNQVKSLVQKATDPRLKESYTSCSENYDDAIGSFQDAIKALAAGDPASLNIQVSAAMDDAGTCQGDLKEVAAEPSLVKKNDDLENVCSIILVISNMLPRNV